jgi:hypothetical protein
MSGSGPSLFTQARLFTQLARALPAYLRSPIDLGTASARIRTDLAQRDKNLRRVVERGIFAIPESPYRQLLVHAGFEAADVVELVRREGVEGALGMLYDSGVYVSLDEFKGRRPIERGSLRLDVTSRSFDNPVVKAHYVARSGGSRSKGTSVNIELAHLAQGAIYDAVLFGTRGLLDRPYVLWQPTPPYTAGINGSLRYAKLGRSPHRWFAQSVSRPIGRGWQHGMLTSYVVRASRLHGRPLPAPELTPLADAPRVATCLAELKSRGTPAVLNSNVSSGIRVCIAAREHGLDISGTFFRLGGEPLTPARARLVASVGVRAASVYGMGEIGRIGLPCLRPEAPDDVHLALDKLGVIQRTREGTENRPPVPVNVYTTLGLTTPKLMLNVESDDYGVAGERSCGCPLDDLGYARHLHTIRSHEKLTSEGMNFLGYDLIRLMEEVLPGRFGGEPVDYQLVEDEDANGLPRVQLFVSPRLGALSEGDVADCVVDFLNRLPGAGGAYGERWRDARALSVVRREPYATSASKVLALHTLKPKEERTAASSTMRRD